MADVEEQLSTANSTLAARDKHMELLQGQIRRDFRAYLPKGCKILVRYFVF